jgi:hypothetical protein
MCEYSSLLFNESKGLVGRRDSLGNHPLLHALISKIIDGKDIPLQQKVDMRTIPTQYLKSSYVHNMLRRLLGDSLFVRVYHEYANRYYLKKASLESYQRLAEELSGKDLGWFFDQWIKKRGVPRMKIYNVKSSQLGTKWVTRGRVRMVGYDKFTTFVDVGAQTTGAVGRSRVFLGIDSMGNYHNDVPFEIVTDEKPARAILDPGNDVLKIQKLPVKLNDLRDPSAGVMIIGTIANKKYLMERAQKDSAAMDNSGWSFTIKEDSNITLQDLQRQRVFLYGKEEENRVVADLAAKFPMHVRGDSVTAKGETLSDSALTLIQIIENPYIASGTICWVAPLSDRAEPELLPYDASWTLVRGKDEISSGVWEVKDEDLMVEIK